MSGAVVAHVAGAPVEEAVLIIIPLAPLLIAGARLVAVRTWRRLRPRQLD